MTKTIHYTTAGAPTLARFFASDTRHRGVLGPVGSGKSSAMCMEIMRRAREQAVGPDGKRRTRWAIIRNSYRELMDTTVRTWLEWFPEVVFGDFNHSDMQHKVRIGKRGDEPAVECDVLFRAVDRPDDIGKLLSLEITGAWVNEARELPWGVIQALDDRIGRFPPKAEGWATWSGMILDTNPPDDDHWWYRLAEEDRPEGWEFFRQPGGLIADGEAWKVNPKAENLQNLRPGYYEDIWHGKSNDHIRVYYCAEYGFVSEGKPVIPEYADSIHVAPGIIEVDPRLPVYVGVDFGLTPAAVFAQMTTLGRWVVIDELVSEDMGAVRFGELLGFKMRGEYRNCHFHIFGDPAGEQRSQVDERTPFGVIRAQDIEIEPAPTNDFRIRREAIARPMSRLIDGGPGFLISPKCAMTRKGLAGGYAYRRLMIGGMERYKDVPEKNKYSHPVDALGYAMVGAGEGHAVMGLTYEDEDFEMEFDHTGRSAVTGY